MTIKAIVAEICEWGETMNFKSIVITHALLAQYLKEEGFQLQDRKIHSKQLCFAIVMNE